MCGRLNGLPWRSQDCDEQFWAACTGPKHSMYRHGTQICHTSAPQCRIDDRHGLRVEHASSSSTSRRKAAQSRRNGYGHLKVGGKVVSFVMASRCWIADGKVALQVERAAAFFGFLVADPCPLDDDSDGDHGLHPYRDARTKTPRRCVSKHSVQTLYD